MQLIQSYAALIRENYTYLIIGTLIIGVITGLVTPAPGLFIRQFNIPLIIVMIGAMGFTITFKSIGIAAIRDWKGFSFGLGLNFIFAPFLCWLLEGRAACLTPYQLSVSAMPSAKTCPASLSSARLFDKMPPATYRTSITAVMIIPYFNLVEAPSAL